MSVQIFGPSSSPPGALGSRVVIATSGGSAGAHRYWRMLISSTQATYPTPSLSEIELRSSPGGADLTGSGTASASPGPQEPAAGAVDNNTSTNWNSYPSAVPGIWWAYDFGTGVSHAIIEIRITPRQDIYWEAVPKDFLWQFSDDGTNWTTQASLSVPWPSSAAQTISVAPVTTYTYGVHCGTTGNYLNVEAASSPQSTARLELQAQAYTPGTSTYARFLLTGAIYGVITDAGRLRLSLGGIVAMEGSAGGSAGAWFGANRIIAMYRRNVSGQNLAFVLLNATTGAGLTGVVPSGYRSIDGGAQAPVSGTITEKGNGQYNLALSAADCNGNQIGFLFTAAGAVPAQLAIITSADMLADIWGYAIETGWSALESMRVMLSALAGKVSGANTTAIAFRDVGDTKPRIAATVDQYGNRTVITYDKT